MSTTLTDLQERIDQEQAYLVDCREEHEWDAEHLEQAHHIPLSVLEEGEFSPLFPDNKPLYVHCRSGVRAVKASECLRSHYSTVHVVSESFEELKAAGFPLA